jgi:hypothetical protein
LTSLNLSSNGLTRGTLKADYRGTSAKALGAKWGSNDEHYGSDLQGIIALANVIPDMGALTSLNMSANGLKGAETGKALGDAIATNTVLKELDISGGQYSDQKCDVEFVQAFSVGLRDNGAISQFTFSGDRSDSKPVTMEASMTEADFSGQGLGLSGAIMLSAFLPKCT